MNSTSKFKSASTAARQQTLVTGDTGVKTTAAIPNKPAGSVTRNLVPGPSVVLKFHGSTSSETCFRLMPFGEMDTI